VLHQLPPPRVTGRERARQQTRVCAQINWNFLLRRVAGGGKLVCTGGEGGGIPVCVCKEGATQYRLPVI
jgi:hypothetical protein